MARRPPSGIQVACPDHGPDLVCEREGQETDGWGFPHRNRLQPGQEAARHCHDCGGLVRRSEVRWTYAQVGRVRLKWWPLCPACWQRHVDDFDHRVDAGAKPGVA